MDIQIFGRLLRNVQPTQREKGGLFLGYVLSYADVYLYFTKTIQHIFFLIFALLNLFGLIF